MQSTFISLNNYDLVSVSGPDCKNFLQGQVTCDVEKLSPQQSVVGALCNLKGRVIADFRILELDDECHLVMQSGMAAFVKKVLDKYIVFSKAKTSLLTQRFARYGLIGNQAHSLLEELLEQHPQVDGEVLSRHNLRAVKVFGLVPRYEIWADLEKPDKQGTVILENLSRLCLKGEETDWLLQDISSGIVHITPEMSEVHLPQALNYDKSGLINFKKGCYTGQEIVARMYYRSAAKKQLYHLQGSSLKPSAAPTVLRVEGDASIAQEVITSLLLDNRQVHILALLPVGAEAAGEMYYLDEVGDTELQVQALPF